MTTKLCGVNLKNFLENSREAVSISTICDEYCRFRMFLHLYSSKIDKENQDLLEIKSLSVVERETLLTQEGDKEARQEGDSRTNPKPFDCTCKLTPTKKNIPVNQGLHKSQFVNQPFYFLFYGLDSFS